MTAEDDGGAGPIVAYGRVVQVDPIRPMLKAPRTKRLKLKRDGPLFNFAFDFNLRRYSMALSSPSREHGVLGCILRENTRHVQPIAT